LSYQFKSIEITVDGITIHTQAVDNPNKGRSYHDFWHTMSPEQFENRLKQLEEAIRSFRRKAIEEAQALDAEQNTQETQKNQGPRQVTYDFYSDPGHGWLRVPIGKILELGLQSKISHCSHIKEGYAYLEEDCDAPLFIAEAEKRGFKVNIREHTSNMQSRIHGYPPYSPAALLKVAQEVEA